MLINIFLISSAYLLGSISAAILVCKVLGLPDPRTGGSGNPGTTNVMRLHGKTAAFLTLTGDVFKGIIPVLLAKVIVGSEFIIALSGLAAFLGHIFPIYFKFKGGNFNVASNGYLFCSHGHKVLQIDTEKRRYDHVYDFKDLVVDLEPFWASLRIERRWSSG